MDSCEVYAALKSLAVLLAKGDDPDAKMFEEAADAVADAIAGLYHEKAKAFYILDTQQAAFPDYYAAPDIKFYPHRLAQVFPELFDVPLGDAATTKQRYDAAWAFAAANGDWDVGLPKDNSSGGFPSMVRGYVALKRGESAVAQQHLTWYLKEFSSATPQVGFLMINEIGQALQIENGLRGKKK
jgi:hypothetical protein